MKTVGKLLFNIFGDLGMEDKIALESIRGGWHDIFREPLSLHTWPSDLNAGELLINVDSPAWLQQLKFFKQEITEKLRAFNVKTIRFRHGKVYQGKVRNAGSGLRNTARPLRHISESEREWIEQTVAVIEDEEVRESIRKALAKSVMRNP